MAAAAQSGPAPSEPAQPSTAGRVLDLLAAAGLEVAFGLPGVHNLPFWREQRPDRPRIVGVRHEAAAVFAADGWARATGGPGVAIVTSGPGAANTLAAFGEAAASGSPVLLVASDVPVGPRRVDDSGVRLTRGLLHESVDQGALFSSLAKAVLQPLDPAAAVDAVARAVQLAGAAPSGPVYVGIPADVLAAAAPPADLLPAAERVQPDDMAIDLAARLVDRAVRPVVWVGGGGVAADAAAAVRGLAARISAPVVETFAARGLLAASPSLVGAPPHEPEVAALIGSGDLLVAIGSDLDAMTTRGWSMPRPARLLTVNCDAARAVRGYGEHGVDAVLVADAALGAGGLIPRVVPNAVWCDPAAVTDTVRRRLATHPAWAVVEAVERVCSELPACIAVCDMAVGGYWVGGYAQVPGARRMQYPVGWGTLGYAVPAAVGAACAGMPVLAICGDGGLAMAYGELSTLVQERLPVTVLVIDDGGYGMLRYDQLRAGEPASGVDLAVPDLLALAAAVGLDAVDLGADVERLSDTLLAALVTGRPTLVRLAATFEPPRTTSPRWND